MATDLSELLAEIRRLEEEVENRWEALRQSFGYTLEGHKVRFAAEIRRLHKYYRTGLLRYLARARPFNVLTAPVIYSMIVPLALLDLSITLYQNICFRAYRVPRVRRDHYFVIDRHQLSYLNGIEKFNCVYCGYGNGLMAYSREIISRTEQYWCPIKHARRIHGAHAHYEKFADYGDAENYHAHLERLRRELVSGERQKSDTAE
jgi:hypothetical protein